MPTASLPDLTMHYEMEGEGEPLVLIPYLAADHACYAFQLPEYSARYRCITLDLRGSGLTDKPDEDYTTEQLADDVAALLAHLGIDRAHVAGVSLGAVTGMWLAAKHPERVVSLSLHSPWTATDGFQRAVVTGWQQLARATGNVADTVINGLFPWCFTPELFNSQPEFVSSLRDFVRSRPAQPVDAFLHQTAAVLTHDCDAHLGQITAPTLVTFGRWDLITSTRFAPALTKRISGCELALFENSSHAALHEHAEEFNRVSLEFLGRQSG